MRGKEKKRKEVRWVFMIPAKKSSAVSGSYMRNKQKLTRSDVYSNEDVTWACELDN